jgi:hypothetical protein
MMEWIHWQGQFKCHSQSCEVRYGKRLIYRMYTSTFSDWFSQAVIDFMLGYRTTTVFSEFLLKLQSTDPCALIRLSKIRAEAIATSVSRVLPEGERLLSGWTLFAPEELNTRIGLKFEEKVLLLVCIFSQNRYLRMLNASHTTVSKGFIYCCESI